MVLITSLVVHSEFGIIIREVLKVMGLELGMDVENWPPENIEELVKRIEEPF